MYISNQPTALPTNKLIASHVIAVLMFHYGVDLAPLPPEILESYRFLASVAAGAVVGYIVPDFSNEV